MLVLDVGWVRGAWDSWSGAGSLEWKNIYANKLRNLKKKEKSRKWWNQDSNPGCWSPEPTQLLHFLCCSHPGAFLYKTVNCKMLTFKVYESVSVFFFHLFCFFYLSGPCIPNPCHNGGTCEISEAYRGDTFIGYVCKCPRGFNGIHCQHSKSSTVIVLLLSLIAKYTSHYHSCL